MPQAAANFYSAQFCNFSPRNDRGHGRYKQRGKSSPYWELEQRLGGEADDMVRLPSGWVAVKNRDTLVASEESGGLSASTRSVHSWPPLPQHASARAWTGTSLPAAPPLTPNLFSCWDPLVSWRLARSEAEWFAAETKLGAKACAEQSGIRALVSKIDALFSSHIKTSWAPTALAHINAEATQVDGKRHISLIPKATAFLFES